MSCACCQVRVATKKNTEIQHMMSTSFWSADGKPISAEEFLHNLFGALPDFFKSEEELRKLWSNPMTRKTLLEKLADAGYGEEDLSTLQKLIDAEKSDLFDVLEYVSFAVKPITREVRVADAQTNMFALLKGTSKNLSFDHLILYPSPKGEGQAEFLEVPLTTSRKSFWSLC